jgi:hypothetical protein
MPKGDISFEISFNTESYQIHESALWINDKGLYKQEGKIDFFIVDEKNFERYNSGKRFICHNYLSTNKANLDVNAREKNWYIVFRNNALTSNVNLNLSINVKASTMEDKVQFASPHTSVFDNPLYNIGDTVYFSGISSNDATLFIDGNSFAVPVHDYEWFYEWNTSNYEPGDYLITVESDNEKDEILIKLIDTIPPKIEIDQLSEDNIIDIDEGSIEIAGYSADNFDVEKIEVSINDSEWRLASGLEKWFIQWNISEFELGDYTIRARATDRTGSISIDEKSIAINESGHYWYPNINNFYHKPDIPTNTSNVIIYANVTKNGPFNIHRIVLYWENNTIIKEKNMFRYADNPVQDRHEEDPLKNQSNEPIYGFELGQFPTDTNITYWIVAYDTANNQGVSSKKCFKI